MPPGRLLASRRIVITGAARGLGRSPAPAAAIFPSDFEHVDPGSDAGREPTTAGRLTSREVVDAVMFAITAPRNCAIRAVHLEGTAPVP
jgi:hypothetical protein